MLSNSKDASKGLLAYLGPRCLLVTHLPTEIRNVERQAESLNNEILYIQK